MNRCSVVCFSDALTDKIADVLKVTVCTVYAFYW